MNSARIRLALLVLMLFSTATWAEPGRCRQPRLATVGWADVVATTGVAQTLLQALGYRPSLVTASQQMIFAGMEKQQIDVFLGYWKPVMDDNIRPFLERRAVKVVQPPLLPDAVASLAVPSYTAAAGLKTFADIARFREQLNGQIYGIEPGSGANTTLNRLISENRFGLGGFHLIESSEAAMLAMLQRAVRQHKPMVFVAWKPHPMNLRFQLTYLTGSRDAFGPNEGAASVSAVIAPGYQQECPNIARLLHNLRFDAGGVGELMEPIMNHGEPTEVARGWLKKHPGRLRDWLDGVTTLDGQNGLAAVQAQLR